MNDESREQERDFGQSEHEREVDEQLMNDDEEKPEINLGLNAEEEAKALKSIESEEPLIETLKKQIKESEDIRNNIF